MIRKNRWGLVACSVSIGIAALSGLSVAGAETRPAFVPGRSDCVVTSAQGVNPYRIATFTLLPGERLELGVRGSHHGAHRLETDAGTLAANGNHWTWTAPAAPGIYHGRLYHADDSSVTELNLVVLVPLDRAAGGMLNGYRIGGYPPPVQGREAFYKTPGGFIEVTRENQDTLISPHFRLRQFISKQDAPFPKYVVLKERLLIALEAILEGVNQRGFLADTLFVMSGYRTPVYNRALGNVVNSRHVFGDAADIFVDQNPPDGVMDDLDGDGRSDPADNRVLASIVDEALARAGAAFVGGMGEYPSTRAHGPFVHVDLRGYRARW